MPVTGTFDNRPCRLPTLFRIDRGVLAGKATASSTLQITGTDNRHRQFKFLPRTSPAFLKIAGAGKQRRLKFPLQLLLLALLKISVAF